MIFISLDKAGAEWVVVAYLSGDGRMIEVIEKNKKPHTVTGALISRAPEEIIAEENKIVGKNTDPNVVRELREQHFPELLLGEREGLYFLPRTMSIYQCGKKSNHGLNYDEGYKQFALINEMEEREAKKIVELYKTVAYPNIPVWHESIRRELKQSRTLTNCFGRKVRLLGQWGDDLFKAGYAFKPQSTVVDMVNIGMVKAFNDESDAFQQADLLMQVHDELVYQYPKDFDNMAAFIIKQSFDYMTPLCSYGGREFVIKTDLKVGLNLGEEGMISVKLTEDHEQLRKNLQEAWEKLHDPSKEEIE